MSPGWHHRQVDGHVGLGAGVGLDVGVLGAEELLGPVDGQGLDDVDVLAAAVVALAGVALGVLVGHHRAHGGQDRLRHEVLRGDQLEALVLAAPLVLEGVRDLGVGGLTQTIVDIEKLLLLRLLSRS